MVPVGRINDVLIGLALAFYHADDIVGFGIAQLVLDRIVIAQAKRDSSKARLCSGSKRCIIVLSGGFHHFTHGIGSDPAFQSTLFAALVFGLEIEVCACKAGLNHTPGIACGLGIVNHDDSGSPLTGSFLILVGIAAIVSHGMPLEKSTVIGDKAGVIDQYQHRLTSDIKALVVIPLVFRSHHAIASKNQF